MISVYEKNNRGKLLAVVMALAMVFAGVAVLSSSAETDAAPWNMDGDIVRDQSIYAGTNAVATGDFNVTNGATLTINSGASFVINEGVTMTIDKDSALVVEYGASVIINGTLVVDSDAVLQNGAVYDATNMVNGEYIGFFVNGTLEVAKGGSVDYIAPIVSSGLDVTGDASSKYSAAQSVDAASGTALVTPDITVVSGENNSAVIYLESTESMPFHMNGAGNYGYWTGIKVDTGLADETVVVSYEGRNSSVRDTTDSTGAFWFWVEAGKVTDLTYTIDNVTYTVSVDATYMPIDATEGMMIVGATGSIDVNSTRSAHASFSNQYIQMVAGASVSLEGDIDSVMVEAMATDKTNPNATSWAMISDIYEGVEADRSKDYTAMNFSVTSENLGPVMVDGKVNSRGTSYILNVAGTPVDAGVAIGTTVAVSGTSILNIAVDEKDSGVIALGKAVITDISIEQGSGLALMGNIDVTGIMDVNGALVDDVANNATLYLYSANITVSGTMDIGQYVTTNDENDSYLNIEGTGVALIDNGVVTFEGINGASYETEANRVTTTHYVILTTALTEAAAAEVDVISVYGYEEGTYVLASPYVLESDVEIGEIQLNIEGTVNVPENVTLTISVDADIDTESKGYITVDGTVMDNTADDTFGTSSAETFDAVLSGKIGIKAEVRYTDADVNYYGYTTLANALANTSEGTIELFGNVIIDNALTIQDGVTVEMNGKDITVENGAELIISGILDATSGNIIVPEAEDDFSVAGKVTVDNYIVVGTQDYAGVIAGFYAYGTIGDYNNANFIMSGDVAAENSGIISQINQYGELTVGDLTFTAGETNVAEITVNGKLTAGTITIDGYTFDIVAGALFNGTVANAEGAVSLTNVTGVVSIADVTVDDADRLTLAGQPAVATDDDDKTLESTVAVSNGTVYVTEALNLSAITAEKSFNIAEGTTVILDGSGEITSSNIVVAGTLSILNVGGLTGVNEMDVTGTVAVKEATADDRSAGSANVTNLYVGTTSKDIADGVASTTGIVSGALNFTTAYVAAGSEIPESYAENNNSTEFYIEDTLWLTVYGTRASVTNAPAENADFLGWKDAEGNTVYDNDSNTTGDASEITVGSHDGMLYANVDYEIYSVYIYADNGIGTVAVDGIVLPKISNMYFMDGLTAGNHTISVELKNGYTGEVVMSVGGTTVSGLTFTLSGTEPADREVNITLSGPTASTQDPIVIDQGSGDGMGVTDYLLIILVILVIVLAIFVALRMMRS